MMSYLSCDLLKVLCKALTQSCHTPLKGKVVGSRSYRLASPVSKVRSNHCQMIRGQVCRLALWVPESRLGRVFFKLSIPCFILSSVTDMRALYLSIGFSSPLRYMLTTAFTILNNVLCKSKRTAIARSWSDPLWLTFYDTGSVNRWKSVLLLAGFTRD